MKYLRDHEAYPSGFGNKKARQNNVRSGGLNQMYRLRT